MGRDTYIHLLGHALLEDLGDHIVLIRRAKLSVKSPLRGGAVVALHSLSGRRCQRPLSMSKEAEGEAPHWRSMGAVGKIEGELTVQ